MAQDMLAKVRALIETAESFEAQGNQEAASTYRTKAEELMRKYRIEEEELIAQDPTSMSPVLVPIVVLGSLDHQFQQQYVNLYDIIARHTGTKVHFAWEAKAGGSGYQIVAHTVGYETDVRYAEMIFTAARLVFSEKLEPKVDDTKSDQENAYRLRASGMERIRVAKALWGSTDKVFLARVGRLYKAECKARGEVAALDGRGVTGKVYREQYAGEFVWALQSRLWRAQQAAGYGGGITLYGREDRVKEAFYTHFPTYRPSTEVAVVTECDKCKTTKHESGKCKDCRPRNTTQADLAAARRYGSAAAQRGRQAGTSAANHVELQRGYREQVDTNTDRKALG